MLPSYRVKDTKFDVITLAENILLEVIDVVNNSKYVPNEMFQFYGNPMLEDARAILNNVRIANEMNLTDEDEYEHRKQHQIEARKSSLRLYSDILMNTHAYPKTEYIYANILTKLFDENKKLKNWIKSDKNRKNG